ncbi:MAG: hypothetical protein EAZ85_12530, partial [Bacteroidetes bacterium]
MSKSAVKFIFFVNISFLHFSTTDNPNTGASLSEAETCASVFNRSLQTSPLGEWKRRWFGRIFWFDKFFFDKYF